MTTPRFFRTWTDAFRACRVACKPIAVAVPVGVPGSGVARIEVARITPRGRCRHIEYRHPLSMMEAM